MTYIGKEPIVGNFQKCDALTAEQACLSTVEDVNTVTWLTKP
tara:strand:+ start:782 stop:907 length:126 start_codon:yes stop_codon:yes gene_type:complete